MAMAKYFTRSVTQTVYTAAPIFKDGKNIRVGDEVSGVVYGEFDQAQVIADVLKNNPGCVSAMISSSESSRKFYRMEVEQFFELAEEFVPSIKSNGDDEIEGGDDA